MKNPGKQIDHVFNAFLFDFNSDLYTPKMRKILGWGWGKKGRRVLNGESEGIGKSRMRSYRAYPPMVCICYCEKCIWISSKIRYNVDIVVIAKKRAY